MSPITIIEYFKMHAVGQNFKKKVRKPLLGMIRSAEGQIKDQKCMQLLKISKKVRKPLLGMLRSAEDQINQSAKGPVSYNWP